MFSQSMDFPLCMHECPYTHSANIDQITILKIWPFYLHHIPCIPDSQIINFSPDLHWTIKHPCACVLSCFSCIWLFATLWTIACQVPLSMGFFRQEYWSALPCPPPGHLPNPPEIKPTALVGGFFTTSATLFSCSVMSYSLWPYQL